MQEGRYTDDQSCAGGNRVGSTKRWVQKSAQTLIAKLNPIIRGWANYHRYVCSHSAFWKADRTVHYQLLRWARRTHPNKSYGWLKQNYFHAAGRFGFFARKRTPNGESKLLRLYALSRTVIQRHIKVRGEANPYDPIYAEYFERRRCFAWRTLPCKRTGKLVLAGV